MLTDTLRLNFHYLQIIHILHPCYHPKIIGHILKNSKRTTVSVSHRYNINRPRSRHEHKCPEYKKCLSMMMFTCIKQHLSNIGDSVHEKVKKQRCLHEKSCTSSLVKFPSFRFLLLFFFQDKYISRSFAITFEIISHRKVLFYDSCYAEPQKFWMIFSPKQKKTKKKKEKKRKKRNCVKSISTAL